MAAPVEQQKRICWAESAPEKAAAAAEPLEKELPGEWPRDTTLAIKETLLGMTIGFAQIPESVAFAYLANIKPPVALHAAWMVGLCCSVLGGRPGMVNGATGAFAAIIATFLPEPEIQGGNGLGVELLFPSVMLAGVIMFVVSALKLSRFILLLPSPVMIGFCNGLATVIGAAQLHPFQDLKTHGWKSGMELLWMLVIMFVAMATMEFMPKIPLKVFKVIPSSLLAIFSAIFIQFVIIPFDQRTVTVGDVSEFTSDSALPIPFFTNYANFGFVEIFTDYDLPKAFDDGWAAFGKIVVQGVLLAVVGTIESLMTSEVVESFVGTPSDGDRTVAAMGLGNFFSGFFGGMGGNAMIGLSTINVLNGGKTRLAPTIAALLVMVSIMGAYPLLNFIPVAALAGIMLVVVLHTFKWFSVPIMFSFFLPKGALGEHAWNLEGWKVPRVESFVIMLVWVECYRTNIADAVIKGTAVCALAFSWNAAKEFGLTTTTTDAGVKVYKMTGPLFFVSANKFLKLMTPEEDPEEVEVHLGFSLMDFSAMQVMSKVSGTYTALGKRLIFCELNRTSVELIEEGRCTVDPFEYRPGGRATPESPARPHGEAAVSAAIGAAVAPVAGRAEEAHAKADPVKTGP